MESLSPEYQESTTVKFEWVVRNLKNLFESSKGEQKSKVTKSVRFGGGRWQILFYANSGSANTEGQTFVSLYLSCEPTAEEKDNAVNGKWFREGVFKFGFELRNLQKNVLFNFKEAHDHSFSYKTQNWGWAQFARRDLVYYQPNAVRTQDAFLIVCTISSSPSPPIQPPAIPRHPVPRDLLNAIGSLLDDPVYSDVEFVLPRRGKSGRGPRRIYAARRLLRRVDYFDAMFHSGFAEASSDGPAFDFESASLDSDPADDGADTSSLTRQFEDSDDEDDDEVLDNDQDQDHDIEVVNRDPPPDAAPEGVHENVQSNSSDVFESWQGIGDEHSSQQGTAESDEQPHRNVRAKLSHPSSPRTRELALEQQEVNVPPAPNPPADANPSSTVPGPRKTRVVVRDVAYATYRAVLYYIYTDTIIFAPLSSSFVASSSSAAKPSVAGPSTPGLVASESQSTAMGMRSAHQQADSSFVSPSTLSPTSRREWIAAWERNNSPGRPLPCSAKAVYRLADKLDLQELRERAFQHIVKSLSVDNVAYEVFSTFSAAFEDVRKVQVHFFLDHWTDIRGSDSMRNVWQQIRLGRHPGFEEVWPVIALNLEFKARSTESPSADGKDGTAGET
ncbi:hypothetical protein SCP_0502820 [Sparassis crispa]|uniref:MATH domain-containing protein n=1 Tax=Sparassis crispa TaxID=139825 RepID=A0A401GM15_9APHY|nr:hypothetical protein SCP_0502820 [Sparassis crispa]GBE83235.1 hypothetical protein SCP_0502820 [Sparassis crispa]